MDMPEVIDYRKYILIGYAILGAGICGLLFYWSVRAVSYKITTRHLIIKFLGLPVRWIRLVDITAIARQPVWYAANWHSTWRAGNRRLIIRRRRGIRRVFSITPESPFVFRAELIAARNELLPPAPESSARAA